MSIERVGGLDDVELPEQFGDTTSWERAKSEPTATARLGRAEWMVTVGDNWNQSGHAEWNLQHKLPIKEVFPDR
jgi:hypothetical protein